MLRIGWTWGAMVAWGSGLLAFALGASAITGAGVALRGTGVALFATAAGAVTWGVVSLARGRVALPRVVVGLAAALAALVLLGFLLSPARIGILPAAAVWMLATVLALLGLVEIRRRRDDSSRPAAGGGVLGIFTGAALVGLLVVPALAATEAGQLTPEQAQSIVDNPHRH